MGYRSVKKMLKKIQYLEKEACFLYKMTERRAEKTCIQGKDGWIFPTGERQKWIGQEGK